MCGTTRRFWITNRLDPSKAGSQCSIHLTNRTFPALPQKYITMDIKLLLLQVPQLQKYGIFSFFFYSLRFFSISPPLAGRWRNRDLFKRRVKKKKKKKALILIYIDTFNTIAVLRQPKRKVWTESPPLQVRYWMALLHVGSREGIR